MCVFHHLVRTGNERGRVAMREYLVFGDDVRARYTSTKMDDWPGLVA